MSHPTAIVRYHKTRRDRVTKYQRTTSGQCTTRRPGVANHYTVPANRQEPTRYKALVLYKDYVRRNTPYFASAQQSVRVQQRTSTPNDVSSLNGDSVPKGTPKASGAPQDFSTAQGDIAPQGVNIPQRGSAARLQRGL